MTHQDLLNSLNNLVTTYLDEGGDPSICADELRELADEIFGLDPVTPTQTPKEEPEWFKNRKPFEEPKGTMTPCPCGCGGFKIG
jgi:hypothetical protein